MCGIMDQYISALGKANHALLIDCRSLATQDVALRLGTSRLLICDTRVKHQHASSAYNERRAQCELAVARMKARWPEIRSLRDVSLGQLETIESSLPAPLGRRSRHVISENERTLAAAAALQAGALAELGALMSASHRSLRDDYEVSSKELNEAVDAAIAEPGVYGARMTGGGFGGCTISLLESSAAPRVSQAIRERLARCFGREPALFCSPACAGVCEHDEPE
jgi:galactokinase